MWIQDPPSHLIDWAFIAALLTTAVTIGTKWLIPALKNIAGGKDQDSAADFRELRGTLAQMATSQAQMAQLLVGRTEMFDRQEKILEKMEAILSAIEHRSVGLDASIRRSESTAATVASMSEHIGQLIPKVDALLIDSTVTDRLHRAQTRKRRNNK